MNKRFLTFLLVSIMIIFASGSFSIVTFAANADANKMNELSEKIEQLSKENKELRILLDSINKESVSKDDVIKFLEDKEDKLIATADHTINRVNFWLTFLGVFLTVLALLSAIAPYLINKPRIDKLEKDIEKYKSDIEAARNELNTSKEELSKSTKLLDASKSEFAKSTKLLKLSRSQFEGVKSRSEDAAECAAAAQEYAEKQFKEVDGKYSLIKREMEEIRDEVKDLAEKAKESEQNAKESENKAKASEYFNKAYSIKGKDVEDIREEIELYTKAIEIDNSIKEAYYNRGIAISELNKYCNSDAEKIENIKKAVDEYSKAITIDNSYGEAYNNRGVALIELNKYCNSNTEKIENFQKAIEDCSTAIKLRDGNKKAYNNRGIAIAELSKYCTSDTEKIENIKKAIENFSRAIDMNRSNDEDISSLLVSLYNRYLAYSELGKLKDKKYYKNALDDLNKCIDVEGETAETYNRISMIYRILGDNDKALLFVDKSLALDGCFGFAYSTKAEIFAEQGEDDQFYEYIELAMKNKCHVWEFIKQDDVYKKYINEPRFIELIDKYKNKEKS